MNRVFVYGTLRQGHGNHVLLRDSEFVRGDITKPEYTMHHLGGFPAVHLGGKTKIHGELYNVDEQTFANLDRLEGYPDFYDRVEIPFDDGPAWMYIMRSTWREDPTIIESGDWNAQ